MSRRGALYVIVSGRVGIEQEKQKGQARLATLETQAYFGEMTLFENSPRSATAVALQDTLTLRLRREPLIALARQYPDLSLELIKVLSDRLRQANRRIAELTRSRPRELQKIYDAPGLKTGEALTLFICGIDGPRTGSTYWRFRLAPCRRKPGKPWPKTLPGRKT